MRVFFDSSAFAKSYVTEAGTQTVLDWCARASELVLSNLAVAEVISVFARLKREEKISSTQYVALKHNFLADLADIDLLPLSDLVLSHCVNALENNTLRTLDAIHIACAKVAEVDQFVTADKRQFEAAKNMELTAVLV